MMVPDHFVDLQILAIDGIALSNERQHRLVMKILSLPSHRLLRLRQQGHRFSAAVAAFHSPCDTTLCGLERTFGFAVPAGMEDARASRQGSEGFQPQVDAGLLPDRGQW